MGPGGDRGGFGVVFVGSKTLILELLCFDSAIDFKDAGDPPCSLDPSRTHKPRQTTKNRFFPGGAVNPVVALATRVGIATHHVDSEGGYHH